MILRRRLHETQVDSSRDEFIPAAVKITAPVNMMGETRCYRGYHVKLTLCIGRVERMKSHPRTSQLRSHVNAA